MIERNTFGSVTDYPSLKAVYNIYDTACKFHQRKIARFIQELNMSISEFYKISNLDFRLKLLHSIKKDFLDRAEQFEKTEHDLMTHMKCFVNGKFNETIQATQAMIKTNSKLSVSALNLKEISNLAYKLYSLTYKIK